jgi:hypothetical protein
MLMELNLIFKKTCRKTYLFVRAEAQNHQYEKPAYEEVLPQRRR